MYNGYGRATVKKGNRQACQIERQLKDVSKRKANGGRAEVESLRRWRKCNSVNRKAIKEL
jgi:hypothetical protein